VSMERGIGSPGAEGPPRLPVPAQPRPCFFQAFSRCQLKHTIALWQLLSAHRSEQLLRLRKVSAAPPPLAWGPPCLLPASCCLCSGLF